MVDSTIDWLSVRECFDLARRENPSGDMGISQSARLDEFNPTTESGLILVLQDDRAAS